MAPKEVLDECIEKIALKDKDAFKSFYEYTKNNVYSFALSIVKNKEDALDILQETYISIYNSAFQYKSTGKPMAWVLTITRNLSLMKIRKQSRITNIENFDCFSSPQSNQNDFLITTVLSKLKDKERQIIILHIISGFKFHEISSMLKTNISTVLSLYHRSLKKLKIELKKEGFYE